jgi:Putative zinc-finger
MRCKKAEKWISDDIDGCLSADQRRLLESHLAECGSCRAYHKRLVNIQKESRGLFLPQVAPGYWQESILRLKARLEARKDGLKIGGRQAIAVFPRRRWAWAGATALLVVAFGLYFILSGPKDSRDIVAFSFEDAIKGINQDIGSNPELERELDLIIQDSIHEHIGEISEVANPFHYENPLFIESLNEEELQLLDRALKTELKI